MKLLSNVNKKVAAGQFLADTLSDAFWNTQRHGVMKSHHLIISTSARSLFCYR